MAWIVLKYFPDRLTNFWAGGLPAFEKKHRRCVYPGGVHPRLAFLVKGEPEWVERQRLLEMAEGIFQRERLALFGD